MAVDRGRRWNEKGRPETGRPWLRSTPKGSRTPVLWLRTRYPRPLDDGGAWHGNGDHRRGGNPVKLPQRTSVRGKERFVKHKNIFDFGNNRRTSAFRVFRTRKHGHTFWEEHLMF